MLCGDLSDGEDDGDDSSSPMEMMPNEFKSALEEFRDQWQQELKPLDGNSTIIRPSNTVKSQNTDDESRAKALFVQGVELEKRGKVYDALQFYRKAIQIVPDIEVKWYESTKKVQIASSTTTNNNLTDSTKNPNSIENCNNEDEDLSDIDLYVKFQNDLLGSGSLIKNSLADIGIITTSKHISELPTEILFYILRWVVSTQLDIRSLEQTAAVCKGLYMCARDDDIWRLICLKVWGFNTGLLSNTSYRCWRDMYIERDRVLFNGCYISKTTYLRYGENSFQDQFYRPVQLIEYYRYFRFFPDGNVIMWTTSEEPAQAVTKLKYLSQLRPEVLRGQFRLHGDIVTIMLKRYQKPVTIKRRGSIASDFDTGCNNGTGSYTYYIELKILCSLKRRFNQLQWNNYSIIQIKNKREITSDFELTPSKYPPIWFSRVKSYHLEAEYPLQ